VVLGAWWSYEVLGWGGYWAWDPVENAAFLPWLTGTAYLHSVRVQEQRGMLRVWNLSLLISTFSLTILATFLTRSGVLDSVHSFGNTGIGPALLAFFALVVAGGVGLLAWRGDLLRSPGAIQSPVSREGAFLANNLLFGAFALVVLLGTVFPLIAQALDGSQLTVGSPYFDRMTMPIAICILFLMAVAPVLPWRSTSPGLIRARLLAPAAIGVATIVVCVLAGVRGFGALVAFGLGAFAAATALRQLFLEVRARGLRGVTGPSGGGMVVHLGVVLIAVGFAASHAFTQTTQLSLARGQSASFAGHTFTYLGTNDVTTSTHTGLEARVRIDGGPVYAPAVSDYPFADEPIGTPSVRSNPFEDVYLTFASTPTTPGGPAVIGVIVEPLVSWIWAGAAIMFAGTLLAAWPRRRRRRSARASPAGSSSLGAPDGEIDPLIPAGAPSGGGQ
jgi:cytochrome c-type biogenesis protein CcmF